MKNNFIRLVTAFTFCVVGSAQASLIGDTVTVETDVLVNGFTVTGGSTDNVLVGAGVELSVVDNFFADIDIAAESINIDVNSFISFTGLSSATIEFDISFTDLDWVGMDGFITAASFDNTPIFEFSGLSTDSTISDLTFGADSVRANFILDISSPLNDLEGIISGSTSISLTTEHREPPSQVPVPTTLALFGLGLAALGFNRRKRLS